MHLQQIQNRLNQMPSEEIEGYLGVLRDQITFTEQKLHAEIDPTKKEELDTLLESKLMLYDDLFEQLKDIKKSRGEHPPKYMGVVNIKVFEHEERHMITLMDEYNHRWNKNLGV